MTQQDYRHPIAPPLELSDEQVGEWLIDDGYPWDFSEQAVITITTNRLKHVACQAFQAGADQELEACCEWLAKPEVALTGKGPNDLRTARRPKPPSAKEQALFALAVLTSADETCSIAEIQQHWHTIRRALEQLDD